ncbi:MAG TPA: hypothetical protein PKN45_06280 [Candidatus Limiplasma sp.]|nr:hypothetical protein [Candidatus Limiplasma sp.]HPR78260.1 hypothetical protein [Candidatus Limiplasma sp.]
MLSEIQQELFDCLHEIGFVRRSRTDDALFICDAPRRNETQQLLPVTQRLTKMGYVITQTENRLWKIDLNDERFQSLFPHISDERIIPFPVDCPASLTIYELACLLSAHPVAWDLQPRPMLCRIVKHTDSVSEMNRMAPMLLEECAERLRGGEPLPSEAAGLLFMLTVHPQRRIQP